MSIHQAYALTSRTETNQLLRRWTALSRTLFFATVLALDLGLTITIAWLTGIGYHLAVYSEYGDLLSYVEVGLFAAVVFVTGSLARGEYQLTNFFAFKPHLRRTVQLWNATFICLLVLGFLAQVTVVYSRGWLLLYWGSNIFLLLLSRYLLVRLVVLGSRAGLISAQRILLFGTGRDIEDFITRYRPRALGVSVIGCHFLTPVDPAAPAQAHQQAVEQDLEATIATARILEPDAIFLVMPWSATDMINSCAEALLELPAEIHLGAEHILDRFEHVRLSKLGPMTSLQLTRLPLSRLERLEKRAFDLVVSSLALLLLTPLLVVVAVLIKLDSKGPVFFLQRRHGFNQKPFRIIKLRTMHTLDDGPSISQAKRGDSRITRVGAWLRRWSIDELPQLINVLLGDMSLVGPRPHAVTHDREYERRISFYARRHNVKPGITGWAQIHGFRGETDTDEKMQSRIEHDLYYIDNCSLWLDLRILAWTVLSQRSHLNAH